MKQVVIYTDGACSGNPGPGGWGAILVYGERKKELSGGEDLTTNNRMELMGAIEALRVLKEPCRVELYTDSRYLVDAVEQGWLKSWKARGWRRKDGPVKNPELWQYELLSSQINPEAWQLRGASTGKLLSRGRQDALLPEESRVMVVRATIQPENSRGVAVTRC